MAPLLEKSANRRTTRLSDAMREATTNLNSSSDDKENASNIKAKGEAKKTSPESTPESKKSGLSNKETNLKTPPNTSRKRSSSRKDEETNRAVSAAEKDAVAASTSTPTRKRSASARDKDENDADDAASEVSSIDMNEDMSFQVRWNCNQLRRRINTFLTNGDMNKTQFQKKLDISAKSLRGFLKATGPRGGMENNTFPAAHQFFAKREDRGYKQPRAKRRKVSNTDLEKSNTDNMPTIIGEKDGVVKVYDTCDDIRTKINSHLKKTGLTKVALAKELSKCQGPGEPDITGAGLGKFQQRSGPLAGNSNRVFYAAYVFFEKLRLQEGKDKSKKRSEMEEIHGAKGVMTDRPIENMHFIMIQGDSAYVDKYAKIRNSRGTW